MVFVRLARSGKDIWLGLTSPYINHTHTPHSASCTSAHYLDYWCILQLALYTFFSHLLQQSPVHIHRSHTLRCDVLSLIWAHQCGVLMAGRMISISATSSYHTQFCMQLTKPHEAKVSCNQVVIDSATYMLKISLALSTM